MTDEQMAALRRELASLREQVEQTNGKIAKVEAWLFERETPTSKRPPRADKLDSLMEVASAGTLTIKAVLATSALISACTLIYALVRGMLGK